MINKETTGNPFLYDFWKNNPITTKLEYSIEVEGSMQQKALQTGVLNNKH